MSASQVVWMIKIEDSVVGPLAWDEVLLVLSRSEVSGPIWIRNCEQDPWKPLPIESHPKSDQIPVQGKEKLVLIRFWTALEKEMGTRGSWAISRDFTYRGILALTQKSPGYEKASLMFRIIPLKGIHLRPITVRGVVDYVLPNSKGFFSRFAEIPQETQEGLSSRN